MRTLLTILVLTSNGGVAALNGAQAPGSETVVVSGVVRDEATGALLEGARVTLEWSGVEFGRRARERQQERAAQLDCEADPFACLFVIEPGERSVSDVTDASGEYEFSGVRAGEYHLYAEADGYITTFAGETGPGPRWPVLDLGAPIERADVELARSADIRGAVHAADGAPMEGVEVSAWSYQYRNGVRMLVEFQTILQPDVTSFERHVVGSQAVTDAAGEYVLVGFPPGEYVLAARRVGDDNLSPVYFPGTTDPEGAAPIRIEQAGDQFGIDFAWRDVPTVDVRGQVPPAIGGTPVQVFLTDRSGEVLSGPVATDGDGAFVLSAVPNREYEVFAFDSVQPHFLGVNVGFTSVFVPDNGVEGLSITLRQPAEVNGRLSWEAVPPAGFDDWTGVRVVLRAREFGDADSGDGVPLPMDPGGGSLYTYDDGTFDAGELSPFEYTVAVSGLPDGAYVESARFGASDPLATGLVPVPDADVSLDIVLGNTPAVIDGTVLDATGRPYPSAVVTLVPDGERRMRRDLIRTMESDDSGEFRFDTVVPGVYRVFAWTMLLPGAIESEEFRLRYETASAYVVVEGLGAASVEVGLIEPSF